MLACPELAEGLIDTSRLKYPSFAIPKARLPFDRPRAFGEQVALPIRPDPVEAGLVCIECNNLVL